MFSSLSRRQLLRLISGLIAGSAAFGSIPFMGKLFASRAQARTAANQVTYKNRTYKIVTKAVEDTAQTIQDTARTINNLYNTPVELYLDGQKVDILREQQTGKYVTYLLPFQKFDSPDALAKELIDLKVSVPKNPVTPQATPQANVVSPTATSSLDNLVTPTATSPFDSQI